MKNTGITKTPRQNRQTKNGISHQNKAEVKFTTSGEVRPVLSEQILP